MEIKNASKASSKSNALRNVNTVWWESRNIPTQLWEMNLEIQGIVMYTTPEGSHFFLSNLYLKQGIGSVYVIFDIICTG